MGRCSVLKGIDVVLNAFFRDIVRLGSLCQHLGVVDSLSSTGDLLASHEEIVGKGVVGVLRVDHGVEGTSGHGVSVKHVEIGVVLFSHNPSKGLLSLRAQVFEGILFVPSLLEHLTACFEVKLDNRVGTFELLEGVLVVNDGKFLGMSLLEVLGQVNDHVADKVEHLKVMVLDLHFHIEASELAQMPVGVGVFSTENGADFKDALHIAAEGHLLVELGGLRETSILLEVLEAEHVCATFRGTSDELG